MAISTPTTLARGTLTSGTDTPSRPNPHNAPEDRHVLAAAVYAKCQVLVTYNVPDFPAASASPHGVTVLTPDQFLLDQLDLHPVWVVRSLREMSHASRKPPLSPSALLDSLARSGLAGFTAEVIRRYPLGTWEVMP
ncbi:MAG: PIN domain-containing protein [Actinobacteria bacterium]|nr:PIN domain-containing protein [Actinomycetota bacterium]